MKHETNLQLKFWKGCHENIQSALNRQESSLKAHFLSCLIVNNTVACRGCWMPGANEVLGCPRIFFIHLPKFLTTPFLVIYPNFSVFRISFQISRKFAPWMPPVLHHAPVKTFFCSCFSHLPYLHFLRKLAPWTPSRVDVRAVTLFAPPLHATVTTSEYLSIINV